jgi:uncharacterized membrane protein YbhN (UPF0104 family)
MKSSSRIKIIFTVFVYISLLFLLLFLSRYDFLALDLKKISIPFLALSGVFLAAGFLINAICWFLFCRVLSPRVSLKEAIISHGLPVFGKYIPGKVWGLLGRAAYLASGGISLNTSAQLSLYTQLVAFWTGFSLGIIGLLIISSSSLLVWVMVIAWVLCALALLAPVYKFNFLSEGSKRRLEQINALRGLMPLGYAVKTVPVFFFFWLIWAVGFFFLAKALFPLYGLGLSVALAFPFAATIGILIFVFPGGLGIREGLLVFYMVSAGMSVEDATVVSIAARLWFLVGEIGIFVVAVALKMTSTKT